MKSALLIPLSESGVAARYIQNVSSEEDRIPVIGISRDEVGIADSAQREGKDVGLYCLQIGIAARTLYRIIKAGEWRIRVGSRRITYESKIAGPQYVRGQAIVEGVCDQT